MKGRFDRSKHEFRKINLCGLCALCPSALNPKTKPRVRNGQRADIAALQRRNNQRYIFAPKNFAPSGSVVGELA